MHSRATVPSIILLIAAMLIVGQGCGSKDKVAASGAAPDEKARFIKRADAICAARELKLDHEVEAVYYRHSGTPESRSKNLKPVHEVAVSAVLVPNLEGEVKELRALGEPSGGEVPMDEIIEVIEELIEETKADPRRFLGIAAPYEKAEKTAEKYGITRCPVR